LSRPTGGRTNGSPRFADPLRAQSAIDRFTSNAYDLVIEGESYRPRLKPRLTKEGKERGR
jgi:hypothetical protein